jgi:hypothetical protein
MNEIAERLDGADLRGAISPPEASGVDRDQLEAMLALSPEQRLRLLEEWIDGIEELRRLMRGGPDGAAG